MDAALPKAASAPPPQNTISEEFRNRTVLVVEDDSVQRQLTARSVERVLALPVMTAEGGREALNLVQVDLKRNICLVLLDLVMPEPDGMETLAQLREQRPDLPVIMVSASTKMEDAVQAMRLGATDFVNKPIPDERLLASALNALHYHQLSEEVARLRRKTREDIGFEDIIGYDSGLREAVDLARKAARRDITVLLTGESGVGKELFARAIHAASSRAGKPFVAVNCGAIPENLVESTLFGHEKGAFTGAVARRSGKFKESHGGTLFLDEVGDLPLAAQVKLLRALQEGEIEPVGADRTEKVDVRIIAATNRNLWQEVAKGTFRDDLMYRLNNLPIRLPALRERKADIPHMIHFFLRRYAELHHQEVPVITEDAVAYLSDYHWPGNVRELESTIYRALVLDTNNLLKKQGFLYFLSHPDTAPVSEADASGKAVHPTAQEESSPDRAKSSAVEVPSIPLLQPGGELTPLAEIEAEAIRFALDFYAQNMTAAAKALGIGKSTLYRRLGEGEEESGQTK